MPGSAKILGHSPAHSPRRTRENPRPDAKTFPPNADGRPGPSEARGSRSRREGVAGKDGAPRSPGKRDQVGQGAAHPRSHRVTGRQGPPTRGGAAPGSDPRRLRPPRRRVRGHGPRCRAALTPPGRGRRFLRGRDAGTKPPVRPREEPHPPPSTRDAVGQSVPPGPGARCIALFQRILQNASRPRDSRGCLLEGRGGGGSRRGAACPRPRGPPGRAP